MLVIKELDEAMCKLVKSMLLSMPNEVKDLLKTNDAFRAMAYVIIADALTRRIIKEMR